IRSRKPFCPRPRNRKTFNVSHGRVALSVALEDRQAASAHKRALFQTSALRSANLSKDERSQLAGQEYGPGHTDEPVRRGKVSRPLPGRIGLCFDRDLLAPKLLCQVGKVTRVGSARVVGKSSKDDLLELRQEDFEDAFQILVAAGGEYQRARA